MLAKLRRGFSLRSTAVVLAGMLVLLVVAARVSVAGTGDGSMTVNAITAAGGASGQSFIFDFSNTGTDIFAPGSQVALEIPADWTAPQTTSPSDAGYVTVADGLGITCAPDLGLTPITGSAPGPWTITVGQTCAVGSDMTITYGAVTPPVATGPNTFYTSTMHGPAGALDGIVTQPTITVDTLAVNFYKQICSSYGLVPKNNNATNLDATGGHPGDLDATHQASLADHSTDLIPTCNTVPGSFIYGPNPTRNETATTGTTTYLSPADLALTRSGGVISIAEVVAPNAGFGAIRCYVDIQNGDNEEWLSGVQATQVDCIAYDVQQTITFANPGPRTYGDAPFDLGATATSGLPVSYLSTTPSVCTVDSSTGFLTPIAAGTCSVTASQVGQASPFWAPADDVTQSFTISPAAAICAINPYTETYNGSPYSATGSCTGVGGVVVPGGYLTFDSTHTAAGTYATDTWSLSDPNYASQSGTITDVINKAPSTTVVTFEVGPYTYRGTPFTATATVTGVGGLSQAVTVNYTGDCTNVTSANGCTATANFGGDANHDPSSGTKSITITKATAVCAINPYNVTYNGAAHTATGSCTGVGGGALPATDLTLSGTKHTAVGDYPSDAWSFSDANYVSQSGSVHDAIAPAPAPALGITKSATETTYSSTSDVLHYTIVLTNTGNVPLANPSVSDPVATSLTCNGGNPLPATLAPGGVITCTATHSITQLDIQLASVTNVAQGWAQFGIIPIPSNLATATVRAAQVASISLVKSVPAGTTFSHVGNEIDYSYVITNTGNVILYAPYAVTDNKVAVTCPALPLTLAPGATVTCHAKYFVTQGDITTGSVTNTATGQVRRRLIGTETVTSGTSLTVPGIQTPALTVTKTATETSFNSTSDTLHYTIVLTNTGNVSLADPTVTDPSATGLSCDGGGAGTTLLPAGVITCTATHPIVQGDINTGSVSNTATGTASFSGTTYTVTAAVRVAAAQGPALGIVKTVPAGTAFSNVGDSITYTYTLTNTGNVALDGPFSVTDNKITDPNSVSCPSTPTSINPGEKIVCTATYKVTQTDITAGSVTNSASGQGFFHEKALVSDPAILKVAAATPEGTEVVGGETATPVRSPTPPVTSSSDTSSGDSAPLGLLMLICLAFGGIGLLAVGAQGRAMRR